MASTIQASQQAACPNYINGQWMQSRSTHTLERRNPADHRDLIGYAPLSSRDEVREAIEAADCARAMWRDTPAPARGKIVLRAARLLEEQKDEVARLLTREEGKILSESMGEILRTGNIM